MIRDRDGYFSGGGSLAQNRISFINKMSGSTPINTLLIGNGKYEDYTCTGNILCNGSPNIQCSRINGTSNLSLYGMITASGCNYVSSGTVTWYESWDGGKTWSAIATGNRTGGYGYAYIYWYNISTSSDGHIWKLSDSVYGDSQWLYVNYYSLTINIKDTMGNNISSGIHVYVDGTWIGAPDSSGNISTLVASGNHTVKLTRDYTCVNTSYDMWIPTQQSWSVSVTSDTTVNTTMCTSNICRSYNNLLLYISTDVTKPRGVYPSCNGIRWSIDPVNYYGAAVFVEDIPESVSPKTATICILAPWDNKAECSTTEYYQVTENSVSPKLTNSTYGDFYVKTGQIWNAVGTKWIEITDICWDKRPNLCAAGISNIFCSSLIPSCCVKTNGYIDINSNLLSVVGQCNSFTPSCNSVPLNTQYMGAFSVGYLTPNHVYTVTCTVKKDGNIIINKSASATAGTDGSLICVLLDSGIWSLLDNWNKIDAGKPLTFDSLSTYIINWTYA